jgi:glycosyltransferase involved in cell wall biosynthesis
MATYNGAAHLQQQLASIAEQSELPSELVVSDDGSSDQTLPIIETFSRSAPFEVRVLPPHHQLRAADNFLHAAEHCRCPLVMFADQDDVWLPQKLAASRQRIAADDSLLGLHQLTLADENLGQSGLFAQGISRDAVYEARTLNPYLEGYGNTMIFRRELTMLVGREKRPVVSGTRMSHDTWLYTLAAALGRVSHIAQPLILYRRHQANVSVLNDFSAATRLRHLASFPLPHYREQRRVMSELATLFAFIAEATDANWSSRAALASETYALRSALIDARLATYEGAKLHQRVASLLRARRLSSLLGIASSTRRKAATKDLLIGVLGLGWRA